MDVELPFMAEYAKSGRTSCKGCKSLIGKESLRLAVMVQSAFHDGKVPNWFHQDCFFKKQRPSTVGDIKNYENLRFEDQKVLQELIAMDVELPFMAEYAKSGRTSCKGCKSLIGKESLRLAVMVQSAFHDGKVPNWFHQDCFFKKQRPSTVGDIKNYENLRFEDQKVLQELIAMDVELPFMAEYAKSGRTSCKGCKSLIGKESLRMAVMVQSAFHDGKVPNWFHQDCFFKKQRPSTVGDIKNYENLRFEDQKVLQELIAMDVELPFMAEYAKSGRTSCKGCKSLIGKESLRLAVMVQSAFHDGKVPNWFHQDCFFKKQRPSTVGDIKNYENLRFEDQKVLQELIAMDVELPFMAEYAKSGRASCKGCKSHIGKESLRMAVMVQSAFHDGKVPNWFHQDCFFKKQRPSTVGDIKNYENLRFEDQKVLQELIAMDVELPFMAEYAKSGRTSCKGCKSLIGKESLRLAVMVQSAFHDGKVPNWFHQDCFFKKQRPSTVGDIKNYENLRFEDQKVLQELIAMDVELPFMAEYAKSGRASCKGCKSLIGKESIRLAVMVQCAFHDGKVPNWFHQDCFFKKQRPSTVGDIKNYENLRFEDQKVLQELIGK